MLLSNYGDDEGGAHSRSGLGRRQGEGGGSDRNGIADAIEIEREAENVFDETMKMFEPT